MDDKASQFFANYFENLTGRRPYPWQRKLFLELVGSASGRWPEVVDLPTGAGKTSVVYIWLLGYSVCRQTGSPGFPRRLVWIVNRRVVVDQVTSELEKFWRRWRFTNCLAANWRLVPCAASLQTTGIGAATRRGRQSLSELSISLGAACYSGVIGRVGITGLSTQVYSDRRAHCQRRSASKPGAGTLAQIDS